jgi:O-antigen/teichoic acid export membrane protein
MSLLMVLSAVLVHTDKLILSRMLSLRDYGYYTLASFVGASLYVLVLPVFHASVPVLSARVARADDAGTRTVYHLTAQSLAVLVIPAAAVLALFAEPLLVVWTRDAATAHQAAPIARLLVIGTAFNGLTGVHYGLQIAYGQPKIGIVIHIGLIAVFLPAIILAASAYGTLGAASVWIGLNLLYIGVVVPFTHAQLMRGEAARWLVGDVLPPGIAGIAAAVVGWQLAANFSLEPMAAFFASIATLIAAWAAATLAAPRVRTWLLPSLLGRHQAVLP